MRNRLSESESESDVRHVELGSLAKLGAASSYYPSHAHTIFPKTLSHPPPFVSSSYCLLRSNSLVRLCLPRPSTNSFYYDHYYYNNYNYYPTTFIKPLNTQSSTSTYRVSLKKGNLAIFVQFLF